MTNSIQTSFRVRPNHSCTWQNVTTRPQFLPRLNMLFWPAVHRVWLLSFTVTKKKKKKVVLSFNTSRGEKLSCRLRFAFTWALGAWRRLCETVLNEHTRTKIAAMSKNDSSERKEAVKGIRKMQFCPADSHTNHNSIDERNGLNKCEHCLSWDSYLLLRSSPAFCPFRRGCCLLRKKKEKN